jgi:lipopolysaccharide transport system ATP-binding protein
MPLALSLEHVSKTYHRGKVRHRDLRNTVAAWWQGPRETETFAALSDINLAIEAGETVGLIGANGAGKSTLLKLLSRITYPTTGRIRIRGTLSSMLEVGTGFHPELTGRDNIYLNGAIIGMRREEVRRKLDSIIDFSDIGDFLDTPVKHYSSGMYVRLAFAVAAHLEPDILLVDEVLAVGDQAFRRKCFDKLADVSGRGRTIIMVSHQMNYLRELCSRGIWLDSGRIRFDGSIDQAVLAYGESAGANPSSELSHRTDRRGSGVVKVSRITLDDGRGHPVAHAASGMPLGVAVHLEHPKIQSGQRADIRLEILDIYGQVVMVADNGISGQDIALQGSSSAWRCMFPKLPLNTQVYSINVRVRIGKELADQLSGALMVDVERGMFYPTGLLPENREGLLVDYTWSAAQD